MSKPPFKFVPISEIVARNQICPERPNIGVLFDYREDQTAEGNKQGYKYYEFIADAIQNCIEGSEGKAYFISPGEHPSTLEFLDGLVIPGGRDMNSEFYGQPRDHRSKHEADADWRFHQTRDLLNETECPVLGICWGMQFLNVAYGGDLVQHLDHAEEHLNHFNTFVQEKGSMLEQIMGEKASGFCYHHQGINKLGKGLRITSRDVLHNYPHGIESEGNGRKVLGVIWHPEKSFAETDSVEIKANRKLFEAFLKFAKDYKIARCAKIKL